MSSGPAPPPAHPSAPGGGGFGAGPGVPLPGLAPQPPPQIDFLPVVLGFPSNSPMATEYPGDTTRISFLRGAAGGAEGADPGDSGVAGSELL